MINIIKDLLKIKNWIKLIKDPGKLKSVILKRFFSYPSKRIGKIQNKYLRNFMIKFWINLSKKNKSFNYFFFSEVDENSKKNFAFNKFSEDVFLSLKNNGIAVIENVLNESEHKKICEKFNNLNNNNELWLEGPKNITKSKDVDIIWAKDDIKQFSNLEMISNQITSKIYGKIIKPSVEFYLHKSNKASEEIILGENHLHMDRFIPNLKIYYSPFDIKYTDAPFSWVLKSHKINKEYIQSWLLNLENFSNVPSFSEKNSYLSTFKKEDIFRAEVKRNSLIAVFTNGYHGRTPFMKKDTSRKVVFLHFGNFNILSLFNFLKYNQ
jgi:hypothetical protein|tara:strand:- start:411 stop:1379 length:969 start_codon:yes stop_codon:yes gene_type:complete